MSRTTLGLDDELNAYLLRVGVREPDLLRRLREETAAMEERSMQISPEQGAFMQMLVRAIGAKRTIEVGVFTGYSALSVALGLPEDGRIVACDVSEEWTTIARRYWQEAGVAERIDLRLAPANDTLDALIEVGECYDFAFIDADKEEYEEYYERCLNLVRSGGLIVVDNVLWKGAVIDPSDASADAVAIRAFNERRSNDARVHLSMVPISDGLTLLQKK